ncbi:MAG: hypothetical protein WCJ09_16850 [Planctomycetota bacterium]
MVPRLSLIAGGLLAFGLFFGTGLLIGGFAGQLAGQRQTYHMRYEEERDFVAPIITANPKFSNVRIGERSVGGIWLAGHVDSQADLELLRNQMLKALGELRATDIMIGVSAGK